MARYSVSSLKGQRYRAAFSNIETLGQQRRQMMMEQTIQKGTIDTQYIQQVREREKERKKERKHSSSRRPK